MRTELAGTVLASERYEYDGAGRLARLVAADQSGSSRVAETYEYGDSGRRTKTLHVDGPLQGQGVGVGCEGTDFIYTAPGAATVTTQYNAGNQPTEMLFCDKGGRLLRRVDFLYDDEGHLLEESQISFEPCLPREFLAGLDAVQLNGVGQLLGAGAAPERRRHRYDSRGHRIETSYSGVFGRRTVTYNDRGDESASDSEFDGRESIIDDHGQIIVSAPHELSSRTEARCHYDYDVHGNWIKKVVEARGSAARDFSTSSVEERTFTYYD